MSPKVYAWAGPNGPTLMCDVEEDYSGDLDLPTSENPSTFFEDQDGNCYEIRRI